jgi:glycosyltransferase involved in cell wall biosynthesis
VPSTDALFYDLYLPTLGGGERYLLAMAEAVADRMAPTLAAPRLPPAADMARLGLATSLPLRKLRPALFPLASRNAGVVVYLANGVPLPSFAERNLAVVQFPMRSLGGGAVGRAVQNRLLDRYELVTYSQYVREWIARRWQRDATVLAPPVSLGTFEPLAKEPIVLAVGRFFAVQHSKRQDVLIRAFRRLHDHMGDGWRLVLAGSVSSAPGTTEYVERLQQEATGLPIDFVLDAPQPVLDDLYRRASLFWHAAGFERPPSAPERAEHFGMSTVEAMSYGAVPLVYRDGGQPEVLAEGGGVLWSTTDELIDATTALIGDQVGREAMAAAASRVSRRFGVDRFRAELSSLL